ncbi:glycosyltransferase family 2 protein [Vibrio rotiferianus]|uniref:glycosyltransferase family 2 protein n=1 Tax=Vibrio rotiferianus TaxID=190895 RepID=UPI002895FFF8|nr:Glycosyl transferase [Vibrio rotiferianus]
MKESSPLITVVIPSFNQGQFLEHNLKSVFAQSIPIEVFVVDGGSSDDSLDIIKKYQHLLSGWRSHKDNGQAAAINEGVQMGKAPYVCWLNSDDFFYEGALQELFAAIHEAPNSPFVYGQCNTTDAFGRDVAKYLTLPFNHYIFANFCFVCQPGTLIRRECWDAVGGLDENLRMAMDYELWWKLANTFGKPRYVKSLVSATRAHQAAKTLNNTDLHYQESMQVVKQYWGGVPAKWHWARPLMHCLRKIEFKYHQLRNKNER